MTDVAGAIRPTIIGYVESPLQALNLIEYCDATGTRVDTMVVDDNVETDGRNLRQIRRVLELAGIEIALVGDRRGTYHNPVRLLRQVGAIAARLPGTGPLVFVAGEYRSNLLWAVVNRHRERVAGVVFVDDGTATLRISRDVPGGSGQVADRFRSKLFSSFGLDSSPHLGATFFSAYGDRIRLGAHDTLLRNDYAYTRRAVGELVTDTDLTYAVGNALAEAGVVAGADVGAKLAVSLVRWAQARNPGSRVVYVSHRRERDETIRALENVCEVAQFDMPFELIPLETGRVPARVVGYYSSVFNNLAHIYLGRVKLDAIEIPPDQLQPAWRGFVSSIYEAYRNDPYIEIHEPPPQ